MSNDDLTIAGYTIVIERLPESARDLYGTATVDHDSKVVSIPLRYDVNAWSINEPNLVSLIENGNSAFSASAILTSITTDEKLVSCCQHFVPNQVSVRDFDAELPVDWRYNRPGVNCMCTNPALAIDGTPVRCVAALPSFTYCNSYVADVWKPIQIGYVEDQPVVVLERKYRHLRVPTYRVVEGEVSTEYPTLSEASQAYADILTVHSGESVAVTDERQGFFTKVLANAVNSR